MESQNSRRKFIKLLLGGAAAGAISLYAANRYFNFLGLKSEASGFVSDAGKLIEYLGRPCAGGISIYLGNVDRLGFDYTIGNSLDSGLHKFLNAFSKEKQAKFKLVYLKPTDLTNFQNYRNFEDYLDSIAGSIQSYYQKFFPHDFAVDVSTEVKDFVDPSNLNIDDIPGIIDSELSDYLYQPYLINFLMPSDMHGLICNKDIGIGGVAYVNDTFNNLGSNISFSTIPTQNGFPLTGKIAGISLHELGHLVGMQHCYEDMCFMSYNRRSVEPKQFGSRCSLIGSRFSDSILKTSGGMPYVDTLAMNKIQDANRVKSDYESHLEHYLNDVAGLGNYIYFVESENKDDSDISTFSFIDTSRARMYIDFYISKAEVLPSIFWK